MKVDIVTINPGGDYYQSLYVDDKLIKSGDEYHDEISTYIRAFLDGLEYAGAKLSKKEFSFNRDEWEYSAFDALYDLDEYLHSLEEQNYYA